MTPRVLLWISIREQPRAIRFLFELAQPDAIYHLAARTFVPDGETDFQGMLDTNLNGTKNILEAVEKNSPKTTVLLVSSAEVYGDPWPGSLPYTEASLLRPASNYRVSKAAADLLAFKFAHRNGVDVVRARPFSHVGPGQSSRFAISSFARQIAEIKLGKRGAKILLVTWRSSGTTQMFLTSSGATAMPY